MQTSAVRQQGSKVFGTTTNNARRSVPATPEQGQAPTVAKVGKRDDAMAFKRGEQITESAQEARQAEPGPSVRNVLVASTALAIIALAIVWLVFFRT